MAHIKRPVLKLSAEKGWLFYESEMHNNITTDLQIHLVHKPFSMFWFITKQKANFTCYRMF